MAMEDKKACKGKETSEKYALRAIKNIAIKSNKYKNIENKEDDTVPDTDRKGPNYSRW